MRSYRFAFIVIFLVFSGGGTIFGYLLAVGLKGPGAVTFGFIMWAIVPEAALIGLIAGLFGCVLLKGLTKGKDELMEKDRADVKYEYRDE